MQPQNALVLRGRPWATEINRRWRSEKKKKKKKKKSQHDPVNRIHINWNVSDIRDANGITPLSE
ncbi:hypothetical protein [Rubripirellula reticaptiva]|uniref:Uncharacterized protein n=1 Tax=Rubripirellula reticaptiva TaxID=2528013 RepID=A0A5C6F5D9_9BACT|nr:hypothetical protein [Rubripirellula reticaptiva]TWU55069.1 hypothetical protein Poly59_13620 [Rubripirellula reticaptiva]